MKFFTNLRLACIPSLAGTLMLGMLSCAKPNLEYPVSYNVINHTGFEIKVIFNGLRSSHHWTSIIADSIIYLAPGSEKTLFISTRDNGTQNPETGPTISAVETIRIYRNDTVESTTDFTQTRYWTYQNLNKTSGEMDLPVETDDFNP
jgi:hypothetical protein